MVAARVGWVVPRQHFWFYSFAAGITAAVGVWGIAKFFHQSLGSVPAPYMVLLASCSGLLSVFAEFEREILRERTRAGLAEARQSGKRLGRPMTAGRQAADIRKLHRAGVGKAEIARRLDIGRTSMCGILAAKYFPAK